MKCSSFFITAPWNFPEFEKVRHRIGQNFPQKNGGPADQDQNITTNANH